LLEVRLQNSDEAREKLEEEIESLRVALRQATGSVVDAASEIDRLRDEHNKKLEQLRAAEEEKERELATLRQESRALEEEKTAAMAKLQELNQRCLNDEKQLVDLGASKRYLFSLPSSTFLSFFPPVPISFGGGEGARVRNSVP
jgi:chromosome segregation ATPase